MSFHSVVQKLGPSGGSAGIPRLFMEHIKYHNTCINPPKKIEERGEKTKDIVRCFTHRLNPPGSQANQHLLVTYYSTKNLACNDRVYSQPN